MDNDDDLFVLIIGDERNDAPEQGQIKLESTFDGDDNIENGIHMSIGECEFSEILQLGGKNSNRSSDYDKVTTDFDEIKSESNEKYDFIYDVEEELPVDNEICSDEEKRTIRRRKLTCYERRSYVLELKKQYPELREDNELLINCLAEVMKALKPPPLPPDFFIMNGIMFQCVKCGVDSTSIPAAERHYHERHGVRYLKCYACGADFGSKTNLYKHERVCSAPDITVALKARALFLARKRPAHRTRHSKPLTSTKPKPKRVRKKPIPGCFKCTLCPTSFASKRGLQTHMYFHTGERPFLCPHCPSTYTSQTTLARHIIHTHGNHYYICDMCQRRFKHKSALALHMNTHDPVKKYACSECDNRYAVKASLQKHVNRDHRGQPLPFACHLCSKRYPWTSSLKDHLRKVHGMVLLTRQGFFKKLPSLSKAQVKQATVILKKDLDVRSTIVF